MAKKKSRASKAAARERRRAAIAQMYLGGASQREIADAVGVSLGTVNRDLKIIRRRWTSESLELGDEIRRDLVRIEQSIGALYRRAVGGHVASVRALLDLIREKARLLDYYGELRRTRAEERGERVSPGQELMDLLGISLETADADDLRLLIQNILHIMQEEAVRDGE